MLRKKARCTKNMGVGLLKKNCNDLVDLLLGSVGACVYVFTDGGLCTCVCLWRPKVDISILFVSHSPV